MTALQAPQSRLGPKSYPTGPICVEIFSATQSPDAGVIAGFHAFDTDRVLYENTDLDGVVPNLDELFTDYELELDGEVASPARRSPFVVDANANAMQCGFLFREDEHKHEPRSFEVELLSILEDSEARGLPTITTVAVDGAAPDLETRMSAELQMLTVPPTANAKASITLAGNDGAMGPVFREMLDGEDAVATAEDVDANMAALAAVLTVPQAKKRRKKVPTPAAKQTPRWHRKRKRNNHAAALNRAKEKATKVASKQRHQRLLFRNSALRIEVQALEAELARLQAARAGGGAVAGTASALAFLDGLAEVEFDLLPPDLPDL